MLHTLLHSSVLFCVSNKKKKLLSMQQKKPQPNSWLKTQFCNWLSQPPGVQQAYSGLDDAVRPLKIQPSLLSLLSQERIRICPRPCHSTIKIWLLNIFETRAMHLSWRGTKCLSSAFYFTLPLNVAAACKKKTETPRVPSKNKGWETKLSQRDTAENQSSRW